ncbi:MAG: zinc ribbon domain-containing protein [Acidobacteria bacterium]|nr:zinc ribbon domain-containing protein [Acidobacteriota bacterium]
MHFIEASRDLAALSRFIPAFIESATRQAESPLAARRRALRQQAAINPVRLDFIGNGRIPHAFELWISHLGWLDRIAAGVQFTLDDLTAEEARGLALFRYEREKFWASHSSCPHCQSVNARGASFCGGCGTEFK